MVWVVVNINAIKSWKRKTICSVQASRISSSSEELLSEKQRKMIALFFHHNLSKSFPGFPNLFNEKMKLLKKFFYMIEMLEGSTEKLELIKVD